VKLQERLCWKMTSVKVLESEECQALRAQAAVVQQPKAVASVQTTLEATKAYGGYSWDEYQL
jgi:hypothetical protein